MTEPYSIWISDTHVEGFWSVHYGPNVLLGLGKSREEAIDNALSPMSGLLTVPMRRTIESFRGLPPEDSR